MTALPPALRTMPGSSYALSCWHRWRGTNRYPARADIDPLDLKRLLPNLFLVEVEPDHHRFRFVLSGETVRENLGFELSSRYLEDLFHDDQLVRIEASYHLVLTGNAQYAMQHWERRGMPVMRFQRLLLPLSSNRHNVDLIFGIALYDRLEGHDGNPIDHIGDPVKVSILTEHTIPLDVPP